MSRRPDWAIEGRDWPNRAASRFVEAGGLTWHVQEMGEGPLVVLLHGTGAASHTWRDVAPLLARRFSVLAPDLPGHGFTSAPRSGDGYSLTRVAASLAELLGVLRAKPAGVVGHSAGAAIALRWALDEPAEVRAIGVNAALLPFPGLLGAWAPLAARALFYNPFAVAMFAARARDPNAVDRLIAGTGSRLDAHGLELYRRLLAKPAHVEAALGWMAHWDLASLRRALPRVRCPLLLLVGGNDRAVAPESADKLVGIVPKLVIERMPEVGHLMHEEAPMAVAARIEAFLAVAP
jgi:magnesium chelatase accessory protein